MCEKHTDNNINPEISLHKYIFHLEFIPCHRKADRSLAFYGKQFPICTRCMSILLGYLAIPIIMLLNLHIAWYLGIILILPTFIDGWTQLKKWRKSNNFLRYATGLLAGIGFSIVAVDIAYKLTILVVDLVN